MHRMGGSRLKDIGSWGGGKQWGSRVQRLTWDQGGEVDRRDGLNSKLKS